MFLQSGIDIFGNACIGDVLRVQQNIDHPLRFGLPIYSALVLTICGDDIRCDFWQRQAPHHDLSDPADRPSTSNQLAGGDGMGAFSEFLKPPEPISL